MGDSSKKIAELREKLKALRAENDQLFEEKSLVIARLQPLATDFRSVKGRYDKAREEEACAEDPVCGLRTELEDILISTDAAREELNRDKNTYRVNSYSYGYPFGQSELSRDKEIIRMSADSKIQSIRGETSTTRSKRYDIQGEINKFERCNGACGNVGHKRLCERLTHDIAEYLDKCCTQRDTVYTMEEQLIRMRLSDKREQTHRNSRNYQLSIVQDKIDVLERKQKVELKKYGSELAVYQERRDLLKEGVERLQKLLDSVEAKKSIPSSTEDDTGTDADITLERLEMELHEFRIDLPEPKSVVDEVVIQGDELDNSDLSQEQESQQDEERREERNEDKGDERVQEEERQQTNEGERIDGSVSDDCESVEVEGIRKHIKREKLDQESERTRNSECSSTLNGDLLENDPDVEVTQVKMNSREGKKREREEKRAKQRESTRNILDSFLNSDSDDEMPEISSFPRKGEEKKDTVEEGESVENMEIADVEGEEKEEKAVDGISMKRDEGKKEEMEKDIVEIDEDEESEETQRDVERETDKERVEEKEIEEQEESEKTEEITMELAITKDTVSIGSTINWTTCDKRDLKNSSTVTAEAECCEKAVVQSPVSTELDLDQFEEGNSVDCSETGVSLVSPVVDIGDEVEKEKQKEKDDNLDSNFNSHDNYVIVDDFVHDEDYDTEPESCFLGDPDDVSSSSTPSPISSLSPSVFSSSASSPIPSLSALFSSSTASIAPLPFSLNSLFSPTTSFPTTDPLLSDINGRKSLADSSVISMPTLSPGIVLTTTPSGFVQEDTVEDLDVLTYFGDCNLDSLPEDNSSEEVRNHSVIENLQQLRANQSLLKQEHCYSRPIPLLTGTVTVPRRMDRARERKQYEWIRDGEKEEGCTRTTTMTGLIDRAKRNNSMNRLISNPITSLPTFPPPRNPPMGIPTCTVPPTYVHPPSINTDYSTPRTYSTPKRGRGRPSLVAEFGTPRSSKSTPRTPRTPRGESMRKRGVRGMRNGQQRVVPTMDELIPVRETPRKREGEKEEEEESRRRSKRSRRDVDFHALVHGK